jgi:hypothetical protein
MINRNPTGIKSEQRFIEPMAKPKRMRNIPIYIGFLVQVKTPSVIK